MTIIGTCDACCQQNVEIRCVTVVGIETWCCADVEACDRFRYPGDSRHWGPPPWNKPQKRCPDCGWTLPRFDCPHYTTCNGVVQWKENGRIYPNRHDTPCPNEGRRKCVCDKCFPKAFEQLLGEPYYLPSKAAVEQQQLGFPPQRGERLREITHYHRPGVFP